ncbi:MAG: ubiquinol-cytochrome c reductase iron-sulfur subunit [Betaproteobacteria bacterium]|nr:ubiquinol-cytochrome c reductase iron-sulfur subunit [Betaproteobacteria bacterium]
MVLDQVDPQKRRFLIAATSVAGAGAAAAVAVPFVASMFPSARAVAAGAPVRVPLGAIEPGQQITVEFRGAPHWVIRRTPEMIAQLSKNDALLADPASKDSKQPDYAKGAGRALKDEWFVVRGVCTHLGCSPTMRKEVAAADLGADWPGGFFCPCHQSKFDMAGRVFKGMPAPLNLAIPPYKFLSDKEILIGDDSKGA